MVDRKQPYIALRENTIAFNSVFFKEATLNKFTRINILVDPENYQVGFKFHNDTTEKDSFTLYTDSTSKNNRNISARQIYKNHNWINKISKLSDSTLKRFKPTYNNIEKIWVINLVPSFEYSAKSEDIPNGMVGIYRYKKDGDVVYIGRGEIKSRASSPERKNWIFDTIEYSIIEDKKKQAEYEGYWIEVHSRKTGNLPIYNKISAKKFNKR